MSVTIDGYDPQDDMLKVKSVQKKFRDSFSGAALDQSKWDSVIGTGGGITVGSGVLTMTSGTTALSETSVTTEETFTIPFRVGIGMTLSQRIANQTFYVEAISVNKLTNEPDGLHSLAWRFDGTTATTAIYEVQNGGLARLASGASTVVTTASGGVYELEPFADEAWFHSASLDATTNRANSYRRHQQIPDPNAVYKVRLRWVNGATPPASTTSAVVQYIAIQDYAELTAEITAGRGNSVAGNAISVLIAGAPAATTAIGQVTLAAAQTLATVTTVSTVTSANLAFPTYITDVTSAALAATATTAAFTPTFGTSYAVAIPVTAVSGTNPTLDISIEESDDTGSNWFKVYDFPRITANGYYRSGALRLIGNRVRYVQTLGGTTPSFTRGILRGQLNYEADAVRQIVDRTVVLTTLSSTTASIDARDCGNRLQLVVNVGAITTTAPQLQLEGSDDNGATWYSIGSPLTAVASSTVQATVVDVHAALVRARVSTAGVGVTAGYVLIKAHD